MTDELTISSRPRTSWVSKGTANPAQVGWAGCKSRAVLSVQTDGLHALCAELPQMPW